VLLAAGFESAGPVLNGAVNIPALCPICGQRLFATGHHAKYQFYNTGHSLFLTAMAF